MAQLYPDKGSARRISPCSGLDIKYIASGTDILTQQAAILAELYSNQESARAAAATAGLDLAGLAAG